MEGRLTIFLLLVFGNTRIEGFDPCTTSNVLRFQEKRCPSNHLQPSEYGLCDNFITEQWYRVDDGADIPTSCPAMFQCGTLFPVWMYGTVPSVSDGMVFRTACLSDSNGCCSRKWTIDVKNCGSYRVYHLKQTDACSSAYCVENRINITTQESSSSSSSSEDVTSSSTETAVESIVSDVTTTKLTTTGRTTTPTSKSTTVKSTSSMEQSTTSQTSVSFAETQGVADKSASPTEQTTTLQRLVSSAETQGVTDPNTKKKPSSTEATKSQVVQQGSPNVLVYVLAAVIGILVLIILLIVMMVRRSKRNKEENEKGNQESPVSTLQSKNNYSELPDPETIYYSIDYEKENESNQENENMYLDAYHPSIGNEGIKHDEALEIEEINSLRVDLENREMYLDAYRKSMTSSSKNDVLERRESRYPYECTQKEEENHTYTKLKNEDLKRHEFVNKGYEPQQYEKIRDSKRESGSTESYDDVTFVMD